MIQLVRPHPLPRPPPIFSILVSRNWRRIEAKAGEVVGLARKELGIIWRA